MALSFFSGGQLNETDLLVGPLGEIGGANSTLLLKFGPETRIDVFSDNRTVIISGAGTEGLFKATNRLLLAMAGEFSLGLDSTGKYLIVVHPSKGHKVGLQWIGGYSVEDVRRVPIKYHGERVELRELILGPLAP